MTGIDRITAERTRQIEVLGYDERQDRVYRNGQLAAAGMAYAQCARYQIAGWADAMAAPDCWPWSDEQWKPSPDPIRNLEKAGALAAAQIDQLQTATGESQ